MRGIIYCMSINKKYFNRLALSQHTPIVQPSPVTTVSPSHPCRMVWNHLNSSGSARELFKLLVRYIKSFGDTARAYCAKNPSHNEVGRRTVRRNYDNVVCVFQYIFHFISGTSITPEIFNLFKGAGGFEEIFQNEFEDSVFCEKMQKLLLKIEGYTAEEWEKEFNAISLTPSLNPQPLPITCPQQIPVDPSLPWWEEFLVWALQGVDPNDIEAAGSAATCVGIAAGVLATGGAAAPYVCTLEAGGLAAATAALAVSVGTEQALAIEQSLLEIAQSCGGSCCVDGVVADGVDTPEECNEVGGDWGVDKCGIEAVK